MNKQRNAEADLKICGDAANADFIAVAREALPYWIKRAQELEESCGGRFKKDKTLGDTIISDAGGMYGIEIKIGDRIINNDELKWHTHKGEGYLTLQEIYEQIKAKGYDGVIVVGTQN